MKNFMQTVNKNIDNNIFLFVISFLIIYNFILYIRVGRFDNIIYFIIIYFALFYYLKNINLSLLITYLLSILLFSRSIMEGLTNADITTLSDYQSKISQEISTLNATITGNTASTATAILNFENKYKNPDPATFNITQFESEKTALLNTVNSNINNMKQTYDDLIKVIAESATSLGTSYDTQISQLQTSKSSLSDSQSGYTNSLQSINTSIGTYEGVYPPQIQGITTQSIFCNTGASQPALLTSLYIPKVNEIFAFTQAPANLIEEINSISAQRQIDPTVSNARIIEILNILKQQNLDKSFVVGNSLLTPLNDTPILFNNTQNPFDWARRFILIEGGYIRFEETNKFIHINNNDRLVVREGTDKTNKFEFLTDGRIRHTASGRFIHIDNNGNPAVTSNCIGESCNFAFLRLYRFK